MVGSTKGGGLGSEDLALCLQICLVPNQHNGEVIAVLDPEDLSEELAYFNETLPVVNGKHQQEAIASTHVLLPHGAKFLLPCSVQDVQPCRDAVHRADLCVGIFNGGVIVRHKVGLDELDGQRALAHAAAAYDHQLVSLAGRGVPGSRPPAPGPPPPSPGRRPAAHVAAAASAAAASPQKYLRMEPSPFGDVSSRLTTEQILYNIKQEYKRMQKRRHLEASFQQTDPGCSSDSQPHAFLISGPASPGTSSATSSPLKKEQPLFTLRQVGMICERLLKEREEKVREEYEEILNTKLAEQYDAFVKFTHDQIMRRYGEQPASYVS